MVVVEAEQLAAPLGRRVGADRLVDLVLLGERDFLVDSVHRRGGPEDEVLWTMASRRFEQAQGPDAVDFFVEHRLSQAGSHSGTCRQMDDIIEATGEQLLDERLVTDVPLDQSIAVVGEKGLYVAPLSLRIVEVVEVVENREPIPPIQEPPGQMGADEARATGDQNVSAHFPSPDSTDLRGGGSIPWASMASTSSS